jgi:hypothetical protein
MSPGAELGGFFEAAGRSIADAQGTLGGGVTDIPAAVAISEAELEVKAAVSRSAEGALQLETLSAEDMRSGAITPGLLSTVRVQYVAVAVDTLTPPSQQPTRTSGEVIENVRKREDVVALDRILGGLAFNAVYVPSGRRWLVTATDAELRVVREVLVPDEKR